MLVTCHYIHSEIGNHIYFQGHIFYCWWGCFSFYYSSTNQMWNRVKKFRYQLHSSRSTKERIWRVFLKSCSLSKKSKSVPVPFCKTILDLFFCDEITNPKALIPSFSWPKTSRAWHQNLTSLVGNKWIQSQLIFIVQIMKY